MTVGGHHLTGPAHLAGVQLECKGRFGVIVGRQVEVVQLVDVSQIHVTAINLVFVEILKEMPTVSENKTIVERWLSQSSCQ